MLFLTILQYIIDTAATVLGGVLLLRFWMQAVRVRPPGAVAQFTFTLTDWLVKPLRRIMPGIGGYDWASLVGAFLVVVLASCLLFVVGYDVQMVLLHALLRFLNWIIYGFMALLIIEADKFRCFAVIAQGEPLWRADRFAQPLDQEMHGSIVRENPAGASVKVDRCR